MAGELIAWDQLPSRLVTDAIRGVWVTGGYKTDWNDRAAADKFAGLELLVVQDTFGSPLWDRADYQLPGAAFAEREGSYVNRAGRLQSVEWAVRPPAGVWVEGQLYWRLLGRPGLYNARDVLDDLAREIVYFAPAAADVADTGVDLAVDLLASS